MHLRDARDDDVAAIQKIVRSRNNRAAFGFVQRPVLHAAIAARADRGEQAQDRLLVAVDLDDQVVGFLRLYHRRDGATTLHELGVREDRQRAGVGSALLTRAIETCRARGQDRLTLSTPQDAASNAYYPRFGFAKSGERAGRKRRLNVYVLDLRTPEERLDDFRDAHDNYLHGECHLFAAALHRLTGLPIGAFIDIDIETGRTFLLHAFVEADGLILDVGGWRDEAAMLQDFDVFDPDPVSLDEPLLFKWGTGRRRLDKDGRAKLKQAEQVARDLLDLIGWPGDARAA